MKTEWGCERTGGDRDTNGNNWGKYGPTALHTCVQTSP